jgi:hypothetical protein
MINVTCSCHHKLASTIHVHSIPTNN